MPITEYWIQVTGRYTFNGILLDCRICGADRGLKFTTPASGYEVTGSCPQGHLWDERRLPAWAVRKAATESERGR